MSVITTSSTRRRSAMRRAVFEPTLPAPTTVTLLTGLLSPASQLRDHRVGDLRRAHGGEVVAVGFHVVGHVLALGDDRRQRGPEVREDVAVKVRADEHVVQLGLLDELHRHVVDYPILELDTRVSVLLLVDLSRG